MALQRRIKEIIDSFITSSPQNRLKMGCGLRIWDRPLIGFSAGDDPLYEFLKEDIGSFMWTPLEAFRLAFPGLSIKGESVSVISWVLPQTKETREEQWREGEYPCEKWARARVLGEALNDGLREHVVAFLQGCGIRAAGPVLLPSWSRRNSPKYGLASSWSERHVAFVSGLGTFGLSDGLITEKGKAVRFGSVLAGVPLHPDKRPYSHHQEHCLFFSEGICGTCAKRCPAGAISKLGHDKEACRSYIRRVTRPYVQKQYGLQGNACGLCQVGVPCEKEIPAGKRATA